jgi:hypothetical protein
LRFFFQGIKIECFIILFLGSINCITKRYACFVCVQGFDSADHLIGHAKYRHKALWDSPRAATLQEDPLDIVRQEGRDEILAQVMPELQRCRRQVEHCHQHHEQQPPMPQLTPRPNYL